MMRRLDPFFSRCSIAQTVLPSVEAFVEISPGSRSRD